MRLLYSPWLFKLYFKASLIFELTFCVHKFLKSLEIGILFNIIWFIVYLN